MSRLRSLILPFALGLLIACTGVPVQLPELPVRLAAANILSGSLAQGLVTATRSGAIRPGSSTAEAMLVTLGAVELALDGAGNAWRAGLPALAESNLTAAERQMAGLQPLLPLDREN